MKILIDIPQAFAVDYNAARFVDFFQRCLADMNTCCGNYELETAEMMEKAFAESKIYDLDKVVEQLENERKFWENAYDSNLGKEKARSYEHAIQIVKGGGVDGN